MGFYDDGSAKKESEYNELAYKMLRIHKLQDNINLLWTAPKEEWRNDFTSNNSAEIGFVLIATNLKRLYVEIRAKCTKDERDKMDELRDKISEKISKGRESVCDTKRHYDDWIKVYNNKKWLELEKLITEFSDKLGDLLEGHGFNPNKDDVRGL